MACQWCGSHIYSVSTSSLPLSSSHLMLRICSGVSTAIRIFILTAFLYSCNLLDSDFTLESGVLSGLFASSFWQHYCSVLGDCVFPVLKIYAYKESRIKNNTVVYLYFQPGEHETLMGFDVNFDWLLTIDNSPFPKMKETKINFFVVVMGKIHLVMVSESCQLVWTMRRWPHCPYHSPTECHFMCCSSRRNCL